MSRVCKKKILFFVVLLLLDLEYRSSGFSTEGRAYQYPEVWYELRDSPLVVFVTTDYEVASHRKLVLVKCCVVLIS